MLYFVRIPVALLFFFCVSIIGTFLLLLRPFHPDNTRLFGRIYACGNKILGISIFIEGREYLHNMPSSVVIANHQHNLDLFICGSVIPERTVSIGKKSLLYLPGFGLLYWLAGNILIDRKNSRRSQSALDLPTQVLKSGKCSIWFFPEGTRNKGKKLLPFKKGAFRMAIKAGVPIQPICIGHYAGRLKLHNWSSGAIQIKILKPISTVGKTLSEAGQLRQECWHKMNQSIKNIETINE